MIRFLRLASLVSVAILLGYTAVRWGGLWRVERVEILGANQLSASTLTKLSQSVKGANILRLDLEGIKDRVEGERWVKRARIKVDFFARAVVIHITERKPVARIGFEGGTAVWVDDEGVALQPADSAVLCGVEPTSGPLPREVVAAAKALEKLDPDFLTLFPCFDASDPDDVVAKSSGGTTVIRCGPIGNLTRKVAILNELWRERGRANLDLTAYAEVDLRWDDEVVLKPRLP